MGQILGEKMRTTNESISFSYSLFKLRRCSRVGISIIGLTARLLFFIIVPFLTITPLNSAEKSTSDKQDVSELAAKPYDFYDTQKVLHDSKVSGTSIALGKVATNSPGLQIGSTTLSFMHYGTMGRQVAHRGSSWVHFDVITHDSGLSFTIKAHLVRISLDSQ